MHRFCHHIGASLQPSKDNILNQEGGQADVSLKIMGRNFQSSSFYVVILNNITKFESHFVEFTVIKPQLQIMNVYESSKESFTPDDLKYLTTIHGKEKEDIERRLLPILVSQKDLVNASVSGEKIIELANIGEMDMSFSHIGFNNIENTCSYKGLEIKGQTCSEGLTIKKGHSKNLTLNFDLPLTEGPGIASFNMYLYHEK